MDCRLASVIVARTSAPGRRRRAGRAPGGPDWLNAPPNTPAPRERRPAAGGGNEAKGHRTHPHPRKTGDLPSITHAHTS